MDSFARLRSKFLASTSFNSKSRAGLEAQKIPGIHLPYLVCLLQTAGYRLGKVDCVNPKYMTQKRTTIELNCGYSGQRCFLYCPEEQEMCNCFVKGEHSSNFFLEAVSQGHLEERWLVDNDNSQYCLPFISDDLKLLCKTVIMELVTMMKDSYKSMSGAKTGHSQNDSGITDCTMVAVPQNSQGSTSLVLDTRKTSQVTNDSTFILRTEMSRDLQKKTVTVSSKKSNFKQSTEHKTESWNMSTACSAVSVKTESISQTSSTILKSPKPSPLPVKNVQKVNSNNTRNSLTPKASLCNRGKSTSNLKVLGGNISTSKDHHSPLSVCNSKSTPNLLAVTAGNNKNAVISSPGNKFATPQLKTPSKPKLTTTLTGAPRPQTPRKTPLKNTSLKVQVRAGSNVASTGKSKPTSPSVSINAASSTTTASKFQKTTTIVKEKTEKVQVTTKASGCFSFKK